MNYEILMAFLPYVERRARAQRFLDMMNDLHELVFRYGYAYVGFDQQPSLDRDSEQETRYLNVWSHPLRINHLLTNERRVKRVA
jgi:hypothetical protein